MSATVIETTDLVADLDEAFVSEFNTETATETTEVSVTEPLLVDTDSAVLLASETTLITTSDAPVLETASTDFQTVELDATVSTSTLSPEVTTTTATTGITDLGTDGLTGTTAPAADIITVSDAAGLAAALAAATDGTVIKLAGGNYGAFNLEDYTTSVTLLSDPSDPASFSGLQFKNVDGMTFDGVTFDYTFSAGEAEWHRPFRFVNCEDITIQNSLVDGDNAVGRGDERDGYGNGTGLRFEGCKGVEIYDSEFDGFMNSLQLSGTSDAVIRGNEFHHMRSDGIQLGGVTNFLIEDNYFHDTVGYPMPEGDAACSADHPDFIQLVGGGASSPTDGLVIRGNLMDQGDGTGTQGIFLTNSEDTPWTNITVENNTIINSYGNGIKIGVTDGLVVKNNSILHGFWDQTQSWAPSLKLDFASTNVSVTGNLACNAGINQLPDTWETANNFQVQSLDPAKPNYYTEHFTGTSGALADPEKFLLKTTSPIYAAGAGSDTLYLEAEGTADTLMARISVGATTGADTFVFDAGLSSLPELTAGVVSLALASAPAEQALVRFDIASGDVLAGTTVVADFAEGALDLRAIATSSGTPIAVARADVQPALDAGQFQIDLTLGVNPAVTGAIGGELMRLDRAFYVGVTDTGEIDFRLKTTDGVWHKAITKGAGLGDGAMHDLSLRYEASGAIQVLVDGEVLVETPITGAMDPGIGTVLAIGGQFGKTPFAGLVEALELTVDGADDLGSLDNPALFLGDEAEVGYTYHWSFDDGVELDGLNVTHSFDEAGYHTVTLTVTAPDGTTSQTDYTVGVAGTALVDYDNQTGDLALVSYGEVNVVADLAPGAIDLRDLDSLLMIGREDIRSMIEAEEFRIDMSIGLDVTETGTIGGEVMRLDRAFYVGVTNSGEIDFRLKTTDGVWNRIITKNADLDDGAMHDVSLRYDACDLIQVVVDDEVLGEVAITEAMDPGIGTVLAIGGQFGTTAFAGLIDELDIDLDFDGLPAFRTFDAAADMLSLAVVDWDLTA